MDSAIIAQENMYTWCKILSILPTRNAWRLYQYFLNPWYCHKTKRNTQRNHEILIFSILSARYSRNASSSLSPAVSHLLHIFRETYSLSLHLIPPLHYYIIWRGWQELGMIKHRDGIESFGFPRGPAASWIIPYLAGEEGKPSAGRLLRYATWCRPSAEG